MSTAAGLATRERLLAVARELIEEGGYGSASVAAIADRAEVAGGTLYRHFASKEELFLEVFRDVCAGEERAMRAAADDAGPGAVDRLEAVLLSDAGWSPPRIAAHLGWHPHTARARLKELAPAAGDITEPAAPQARALLERYIAAFENADAAALEQLLVRDATLAATPFRRLIFPD